VNLVGSRKSGLVDTFRFGLLRFVLYENPSEHSNGKTPVATESIDPHLTSKIVQSYVRHHTVGAGQLSDLITSIHTALGQLGRSSQPEEVPTPAVSVRQSVRHDYVVCLDCGYRGKTLRRHISVRHGLSRDEYLNRWRLRRDHHLTAPAYSEQRSSLAKELGLGRKPTVEVAPAGTSTVPASIDADPGSEAKPTRKRRIRSASKSEAASEAAAENTPTRPRRSRSKSNPDAA
jgi:predicted transcriptional regulator